MRDDDWDEGQNSGEEEPFVPTPEEIDSGSVGGKRQDRPDREDDGEKRQPSRRRRLFWLRRPKGVGERRTEAKPKARGRPDGDEGGESSGPMSSPTSEPPGGAHSDTEEPPGSDRTKTEDPDAEGAAKPLKRIKKPERKRRPSDVPPPERPAAEPLDPDEAEARRLARKKGHRLQPLEATPTVPEQRMATCGDCGMEGRVVRSISPGWSEVASKLDCVGDVFSRRCNGPGF